MKVLSALHKLASRSVIKQFADKHGLVYFGSVDSRSDDHQLVRGATVGVDHVDSHYTVGTFSGHDLIFVDRTNTVAHPKKSSSRHRWLILQLDLKRAGLPHIFIDSHHDEAFRANMVIGNTKLRDVTNLVPNLGHVNVLAPVEHLNDLHTIFKPDFANTTASFKHFDYEINDDRLFVYAHNPMVTGVLLADMLRVGSWLATYLDTVQNKNPAE